MLITDFTGQVAIVTGAGQGIGLEICSHLAAGGATVLLNDLDPELAANAVKKINEQHGQCCYGLAGDAGDIEFIKQMTNTAVQQLGRLDIIVANAGITLFGDFLDYTPEAFYKVLHTNLGGSFFLAQAGAQQMIKKGSG